MNNFGKKNIRNNDSDEDLNIRMFNEEVGLVILDENYVFNYIYSDGFNERLLRADFVVDYQFNYRLKLEAFMHTTLTKNKSSYIIYEGKLDEENKKRIEDIIYGDYKNLKSVYNYEYFVMTDVEQQLLLFNIDHNTTNVFIEGNLPEEYFSTTIEKQLFCFNNNLKKKIERLYTDWLIS
ncbi:hypothetical protein [Elizabethkingia miricola]|uniref:hypothetical protein n=1 Tax=Elizabethkingia miricola TaxID=172045 RepID=UPI0009994255|nr:hypothetical protein [Elizabethkingia miricola]OPC16654.1 hypothetical protein BAY01_02855 [Elizabethkingia miricola]